uniref:Uncharacterized protein n=1 Tax=Panagrolaimus sp. JU765 TaxID=591449 RepID=A0AC34QA02_9BILA
MQQPFLLLICLLFQSILGDVLENGVELSDQYDRPIFSGANGAITTTEESTLNATAFVCQCFLNPIIASTIAPGPNSVATSFQTTVPNLTTTKHSGSESSRTFSAFFATFMAFIVIF